MASAVCCDCGNYVEFGHDIYTHQSSPELGYPSEKLSFDQMGHLLMKCKCGGILTILRNRSIDTHKLSVISNRADKSRFVDDDILSVKNKSS